MNLHLGRMTVTLALLAGEIALMLSEAKYWQLWCGLLCAAVVAFNFWPILQTVRRLLTRRRRRS